MALDLGELVARLRVDSDALDRGLSRAEHKLGDFGQHAARDIEAPLGESGERGASGMVARLAQGMGALGPAVMPVLATVGAAGGGVLAAGLVAALVAAVPLLLAGGVLAAGIMAAARDPAVGKAFAPLKEQASKALDKFAEPFKGPLIRAATTFGNALEKATPFLERMGQAVAPIIDKLAPALADMALNALPGITQAVQDGAPLIEGLVGVLPALGSGLAWVLGGIHDLLPYAKQIGGVFQDIGGWLADVLIPPLKQIGGQYLGALRDAVADVTGAFKENEPEIKTFVGWIKDGASWVGDHLAPVLGGALVANIKVAVGVIKGFITIIGGIVNAVRGVEKVPGWFRDWFSAAKKYATDKVTELVNWLKGLPSRIKGAVGDLGSLLASAGRSVIDGFIRGIRAGFDRVRSTLGELTGMLPDWKGPADRDRKLLTGAGQLIMGGFLTGLESRYGQVRASLGAFTDDLTSPALSALSAPLALPGAASRIPVHGALGGSAGRPARLEVSWKTSGNRVMDKIMEALRFELRSEGLPGALG